MKPGMQIVKAIFEGLIQIIPMIRNRRKQGAVEIPVATDAPASVMRVRAAEAAARHAKEVVDGRS